MSSNDAVQQGRADIDGVTIRYRVRGEGPTIVFVHGVYVGGCLWNDVVGRLADFRCITPTWPLGAHADPAPHADLSARAVAHRIPEFLEELDLTDVTLVGNDTGGGLCLASLATSHPGLDRIGRLVLTNCDSYEHFPPEGFDRIARLSRRLPLFGRAFLAFFASRRGRRKFMQAVTVRPPQGRRLDEVFESFITSKASRKDALRTTQSLEPSVTLDAVDALRSFARPVLLAWGDSDQLFPVEHAERLRADFPDARLEVMEGASTFVMVDKPAELAELIRDFVSATS